MNGKCEKITCSTGEHYDPTQKKCIPDRPPCPKVQGVSGGSSDDCPPCPKSENGIAKLCPPPIVCKKGEHYDPKLNKCVPDNLCPPGFHLQNKDCVRNIVIRVTKVETVIRNFITSQPTFLLLLDTAQLCQLAGDTQCVSKQNQFNTFNLITKLDSTAKTWTITGQVENRVSKTQNNVQVIGYFYDSKGNSVGGPYKGTVNPISLKSLQLGAFGMKPSTSIMKGTPSFIRLEYQNTTS